MAREFFGKWLREWDTQLGDEGRTLCFRVDNCSAHFADVPLSNTELKFLSLNTTSKLQPLHQVIIRTFKAIYKRRLIEWLLIRLRMNEDLKIDLLGAIQMLKAAWESVNKEMIAKCFRHAGFTVGVDAAEEPTEYVEGSEEVVELDEMWSDLSRFVGDA
nr:tigger transposable element-derived protein 6-like [Rhipicephalus microplus]